MGNCLSSAPVDEWRAVTSIEIPKHEVLDPSLAANVDEADGNAALSSTIPADAKATQHEALTIVSMNIAACVPSQSSPDDWTDRMSADAIRKEILDHDPDVIALQECPGGACWAFEMFPSYRCMGVQFSHAGQVMLLVRKGIQANSVPAPPTNSSLRGSLPAVVAEIELNIDRHILVASVHLAPFDQGEAKRRMQMESLVQLASLEDIPIIIAGDTNMRDKEDATMENELNLLDIWKLAGSSTETRYTWDTIDHRRDGGSFNRYYGEKTRQYKRRYDRMYVSRAGSRLDVAASPTFELVANYPMTLYNDFLSDHFGMASSLQLAWSLG